MDCKTKIKTPLAALLLCLSLAACAPAETVVQTAIVQTQAALPSATSADPGNLSLVQTAVAQTLTPAAAAASTAAVEHIQAAVLQTLTALPPTQTATPQISPTPLTPVPSATATHAPWPTITNTVEAYLPSGPITLVSVEATGDNKATLTWQADGSFQNGFYVVWSPSNALPAYPDDYWFYFANGHARKAEVDVKQAKSTFFRVCEFAADRKHCINYSNAIQVTIK